jgi:hypothetical protein
MDVFPKFIMEDQYVLVQWPESQHLMHKSWFKECFLANPSNDEQDWVGSSAYFVPKVRFNEPDYLTAEEFDLQIP